MREVTYREWEKGDCVFVAELEKHCFDDPWSLSMVEGSFSDDAFFGYVAVSGEELIGYVGMSCVFETADVLLIAVREDYRKCGIATELLKIAFGKTRLLGGERVMLEVDTKNVAACRCYEKLRFNRIAERKNYYGEGKDAYIMEKVLLNDL